MSKNMNIINKFMHNKKIKSNLQYQVREYLEYYWKESSMHNTQEEENIINLLSSSLKEELLFQANKIILKESPIFHENFSVNLLHKIIPLIKEYRCTPEELIFLEGEIDDSSIYFIQNGQIELFYTKNVDLN